jgi:neutral amino acid transport system permease protein
VTTTTEPTALAQSPLGSHGAARVERPLVYLAAVLVVVAVVLALAEGLEPLLQTTINGIVSGSYIALAAVGVTLMFALLRLVNFAHGDFLTLGAYIAVFSQTHIASSLVVATLVAVAVMGFFSAAMEFALWRPIRRRGAGFFQLVLVALGLAYIIRYGIQVAVGANQRQLDVNVIDSVRFGGLHIGRTQLIVTLVALTVIVAFAVVLKRTALGKKMRAIADNRSLAETTGIDTSRMVVIAWMISGAFAGLAGVLYAAPIGYITPNLGFGIVLSVFAAVIVGGIGSLYGALAGGLLVGVVQEWSTLVIAPELKVAVGFAMLIAVLLVRPRGLFARAASVEGQS